MKIKVRPVGIIRKYFTEHELETADGLTPEQLIRDLKIPGKAQDGFHCKRKKYPAQGKIERRG